jgi:predicted  nucleic acid-binding Zn-ribbon protein
MAAITATTSATRPGAQLSALQYKLQQAKQEAARAENNLASLQSQTEQARRQADDSLRSVASLQSQSQQAQTESQASTVATVTTQAESLQAKTPSPAVGNYVKLAEDSVRFGFKLQTGPSAQLFVNAQGQSTGRIVSVKA